MRQRLSLLHTMLLACIGLVVLAAPSHATQTITASAGVGGTIAPAGSVVVNDGDDQAFTITPDPCYMINDVQVDGASEGSPTSYTFVNVQTAHTIEASFSLLTYVIVASASGGGSISPSGVVSVNCGSDQAFTFTPQPGFSVGDIQADGAIVPPANSYVFTNVTSNHNLRVRFAPDSSCNSNDQEQSLGVYRIEVVPQFWSLVSACPGYTLVDGVHRLTSPVMYDPSTVIGRSVQIAEGDADDVGGVAVGCAGTMVSDADVTQFPAGFEGAAGTAEIHTELYSLNMVSWDGSGSAVRAGINAPGRPKSVGEIEGPSNASLFPGNSFFDVFAEVDVSMIDGTPGLTTLYNATPLLVENSNITSLPPQVVYIHKSTGPVPVLFKTTDGQSRWQAGDQLGWLVLAGHGFQFDSTSGSHLVTRKGGVATMDAGLDQFLQVMSAEPEMANEATRHADVLDVIASSDLSAYVDPADRDLLSDGLAAAATKASDGDYCGAVHDLAYNLLVRVDGIDTPPDWVQDETLRASLNHRISALAEEYQAKANLSGGCSPLAVGPASVPTRVAIQSIRPNPMSRSATIGFGIPRRTHVTLAIHDLNGRRLRTLVDGELTAGTHSVTWNGRQDNGALAPSGIYFAHLVSAGVDDVRRIVVVK